MASRTTRERHRTVHMLEPAEDVQNDSARVRNRSALSGIKFLVRSADASLMAIVPRRLVEKMTFFQTHLVPFAENRAAIGLTTEDVDDLDAKLAVAKDAFKEQQGA